ncbi:hypothetical Protein YC6258_05773 [Gynuella sunshinyii YC6258]|uniref:Uncharacterized protein n=1 Tax=Gynuella sunshinyii YC6258 TaxID=1445510 RepID=A0A0C5VUH7_9GAMM|nr:hypothetical Protein YC6258_05773 [Gynuella sunshinyii YC6258]
MRKAECIKFCSVVEKHPAWVQKILSASFRQLCANRMITLQSVDWP